MVEGAVMVALATVLCFIRVIKFPWGGSVTLLSMLPITVYALRYGVKQGITAAFVFSLIQLLQGIMDGLFGWGLTPGSLIACIFIDYIAAFTVLGFAGLFHRKGTAGWITGTILAAVLRFICHFVSGVVIWHSFGELWSGFETSNEILYSLCYNAAYMLPETIFMIIGTVVMLKIPQLKRMIYR